MKKRAAIYLFGTVLAVLALTVAIIQSPRFEAWVCERVEREAGQAVNARVDIHHVQIRLLSLQPRIELFDVQLFPRNPGKPVANEPSFEASRVAVVLRPLQLWARRIDIDRIEVDDPHLDLVQRNGKWIGLPPGMFVENPVVEGSAPTDALQVRVDAFLITNGTLHVSAETSDLQLGLTQIRALGTFEGNGNLVVDVSADGRRVMARIGEDWFEEFIDSVSGQVIVSDKNIEVRAAKLETDSLSLSADGTFGLGKQTDVRFSRLLAVAPLEFVKRVVPQAPAMEGELTWTGSIAVDPKGFRLRGLAKINDFWLQGFHLGATEADVDVTSDRADVKRLRIGGAGGVVEGPAELSWPGGALAIKADLGLDGARFARILDIVGVQGSHVDMGMDGRVAFAGGLSPLAIRGTLDLDHSSFTWRNRPWNEAGPVTPNLAVPDGHLSGGFALNYDGIKFENVAATAGSTGMTLGGDLFFRGATDIRFAMAPLAFGEIGQIAGVKLRGTGPASGRVHGKFQEILLEAELDLDGLNVAGFDFGRGTGPLRFSIGEFTISSTGTKFVRGRSRYEGPWKVDLNVPALSFDVTTKDARIEDMADIVFADIGASKHAQGNVSGRIALSGPFDALDGSFDLAGTDLAVAGERFASYRGKGRWRKGDIWLDDLVATKGSGAQIYARGSLGVPPDGDADGLGGPVNLEVHTARLTLADLQAVGSESVLASEIGLRLHLGGRFYRPEPRGRLDFGGTRLYGQALGATQVNFETIAAKPGGPKDRLSFDGTVAGGSVKARGSVHLKSLAEMPYESELVLTRHNIKPYFMALNPRIARDPEVKAIASAVLKLAGDVWKGGTRVGLTSNQLLLQRGPHQIRNEGDLVVVSGPSGFTLEKVALRSESTPAPFVLSGGTKDGTTDVRAKGPIDLVFVELLTDIFGRIEGRLDVTDFRVYGKDSLEYEGLAEISGGTFKTRAFPLGPEDVAGRIRIANRQVSIEQLAGKLGGGTFNGEGNILLSAEHVGVQRFDLGPFKLTDVNLRFPSQAFSGRVSGDLYFTGGYAGDNLPELLGEMVIEEARYTGPIEWKAQAVAFKSVSTVSVATKDAKLMRLNIGMTADDNIWVRNDLGQIEFYTPKDDSLRLVGDNTAFGLLGGLELKRGRIVLMNREFAMTKASIHFRDTKQIDFDYDITAETLIRDWQIILKASGRKSRGVPTINFDSNPPLSDEDETLLVFHGLTSQELKASGEDIGAALALAASTVGQGLGEQRGVTTRIKKALTLDSFEIVPSYAEGGSIGIKVAGRKVVNDDLSLSGSVGQSDRVSATVQADYRLSRRLHVVGAWSNEEQRTTAASEQEAINDQGDVSVDARFRFEWK